jgi:transposase-like protein
MDLISFQEKFKNEQTCINWLINKRFGSKENITCPYCKFDKTYKFQNGKLFKCANSKCLQKFSIRIGTMFEGSNISLQKWFLAIYLFTSLKKGLSSVQLSKYISTTQKTAWFILQRIRTTMEENNNQFEGISEIDEVYIGGRAKMENKMSNKTVVIGIVNREKQEVIAKKVDSAKTYDLQPEIYKKVKEGSTIITDEWRAYNVLKWNYNHHKVNHSKGEYVKKDNRVAYKIHTNTIEGFWSHLKRGINGIYIWVSNKHINKYLLEYSYRYNKRALTDFARFENFFENCERKNLSYKELIV